MSDLKPCPFCGSGAIEVSAWEDHTTIGCLDCDYGIRCQDCDEEDAVDWWNTRPVEDAKDKEIERLKVHCNALYDSLFILQRFFEHFADDAKLSKEAQDAHLEMVTTIVKVVATARKHGIGGTICPACKHKDCKNCDLDTILNIWEQEFSNAPDTNGGTMEERK